jgi:spore coat protein A
MRLNRRHFLRLGALAGAGLALGPRRLAWARTSPRLAPFVDALPIPPVLPPAARREIHMREVFQKLHRDLPATRVWTYDGTYIGPTIEARSGAPLEVEWRNELPDRHLFAIDHSLHGAEASVPDVRTVVHLHGTKVPGDSDGHPEAWFTRGFAQTGRVFSRRTSRYPNDQPAATLWYHDHALGITRLNVYAGLAGFYILRDEAEDALPLPRGPYEVPLMFQDRAFTAGGALDYPVQGPVGPGVPATWMPEFFGDAALVNGKVTPFLDVEPRRYRFRMLNACNARFLRLTVASDADPHETLPMHQIGADQGLLPRPVELADLLLAPAERADVVIDFGGKAGKRFTVGNDAAAPFPGGGAAGAVPAFLQFRVTLPLTHSDQPLPASLAPVVPLPTAGVPIRRLLIAEMDDEAKGDPMMGMLGTLEGGGRRFHEPSTENPRAGSTEVWELYNTTTDAHPIHLHLVRFQILDRQPFDLAALRATGQVRFTGPPEPPAANESPAWKDVVKAYPGDPANGIGRVTRIVQTFDLPRGETAATAAALPDYMWHCHILEHEDNEMMRPLKLLP